MGSESPIRLLKGKDSSLSAALDNFGKLRVSNAVTLFTNKNIHTRNKNLWEEPIVGALVGHGAVTGGPFQVAETITGSVSGTVGTVTAVDGGGLTVTYTVNHDDFEVGETITGGTSGATATITTIRTGSTVFHDRDNAAVIIQVGQSDGDSATRVSHLYIPYVPGKSQACYQTFLLGEAVENVERTVGYGNPENGLFLNQTIDGLRFIRRTKTSGAVVDNLVEQFGEDGWNVDKFDGSGPSGKTLDVTKLIFLFIDFAWQGGGPIRMGFWVDGVPYTAHEFKLFNELDTVFMSTPSLPVFYNIKNTGATASTNILKEYCTSVVSEGGERLTGVGFSISVDATPRSVTTEAPVLAIRLKNTFGGGENRKIVRFANSGMFAKDNAAHFEIKHMHDPDGITATWQDIGGGSAVEFSTDITAITGNPEHKIQEGYVGAGQAGKGASEQAIEEDELDQHQIITQDINATNSEVFAVFAISLEAQAALVYPHLGWKEFD